MALVCPVCTAGPGRGWCGESRDRRLLLCHHWYWHWGPLLTSQDPDTADTSLDTDPGHSHGDASDRLTGEGRDDTRLLLRHVRHAAAEARDT